MRIRYNGNDKEMEDQMTKEMEDQMMEDFRSLAISVSFLILFNNIIDRNMLLYFLPIFTRYPPCNKIDLVTSCPKHMNEKK